MSTIQCQVCFGSGTTIYTTDRYTREVVCSYCKGKGSTPGPADEPEAPLTPDQDLRCANCHGMGSYMVTREGTTERVTCGECNGTGQLPTQRAPDLTQSMFLHEVWLEFKAATDKFPAAGNPTALALAEEAGEVAKALLQEPSAMVKRECIQLAAMAMRVAMQGDETVNPWRAEHKLDIHPESRP